MPAWFLAAWLLGHPLGARGAEAPKDGWPNLKHITRDRLYAVVLREGGCEYGVISSVGEQFLILGTDSALGLALKRSQIVRVSDNLTAPARIAVFSGRSSWVDVMAATPTGNEYLHVVTKSGQELKLRQPQVSADAILAEGAGIGKSEVRFVSYVRNKPLDVDEEYLHIDDLKWLKSIPYVGEHLPTRISVPLYNADLPEDNSPLKCR